MMGEFEKRPANAEAEAPECSCACAETPGNSPVRLADVADTARPHDVHAAPPPSKPAKPAAPHKPPRRVKRWTLARRAVQVLVALVYAVPILAVGWGLFGAIPGGEEPVATPSQLPIWGSLTSGHLIGPDLLDPFAALQVAAAAKTFAFAGLVWTLPVLVFYALVRGRAFCGWACPVNLVLEGLDWLRKKTGLKVAEMPVPRWAKVAVAVCLLALSAVVGVPLFEGLSPVGALSKAVLFGSFVGVWTLAAIVVAELFWGHRVWCRALCPLGGMYQTIGCAGLLSVAIDHDACIKCNTCKAACLSDPAILDDAVAGRANRVASGDCMLCGSCVDACPANALRVAPMVPKRPTL